MAALKDKYIRKTRLEGSNLPSGYRLLGKYHPISPKIFGISIVIWLIATWLCSVIINVIRPEFNSHGFVIHLVDSLSEYSYRLKVIGFGLLAALVTGFLHEPTHGLFHWVFIKKWPKFGIKWKTLTPYAAVFPGFYYSRNKACLTALSPIVVVSFIGIVSWYMLPLSAIPVAILVISINLGSCISDLLQTRWILSFKSNTLYGFDSSQSVIYGPSD